MTVLLCLVQMFSKLWCWCALLDQLAGELAEQPGQNVLLQQALALPRRAAVLRDLSFALRELIGLERRQLGIDRGRLLGLSKLSCCW